MRVSVIKFLPHGIAELTPQSICESLRLSMVRLNRLKSLAPDPKAQMKYKSSSDWINTVHVRWGNVGHTLQSLDLVRF